MDDTSDDLLLMGCESQGERDQGVRDHHDGTPGLDGLRKGGCWGTFQAQIDWCREDGSHDGGTHYTWLEDHWGTYWPDRENMGMDIRQREIDPAVRTDDPPYETDPAPLAEGADNLLHENPPAWPLDPHQDQPFPHDQRAWEGWGEWGKILGRDGGGVPGKDVDQTRCFLWWMALT